MQITTCHASTTAVWADAVFVSVLQRSDQPGPWSGPPGHRRGRRAHGEQGCAQRVAQEFGDHPETAVTRMLWARVVAGEAFAPPPAPAQDYARRRPGQPVAGPRTRQLASI